MRVLRSFLIKRALFGIKDPEIVNPYDKVKEKALYDMFNEAHDRVEYNYKNTGLNPLGYWIADKGGSAAGNIAGYADRSWSGIKRVGTGISNGIKHSGDAVRDTLWDTGSKVQRSPLAFLAGASTVGALGNRAGDALARVLKWKNDGFGANALRWIGTIGGGAIGGIGAAAIAHRLKQRKGGYPPHDTPTLNDLSKLNAKDYDRDTTVFD